MSTNEIKSMSLTEIADRLEETLFGLLAIASMTGNAILTPDKMLATADLSSEFGDLLHEIRARDAQGGEAVTEGYER